MILGPARQNTARRLFAVASVLCLALLFTSCGANPTPILPGQNSGSSSGFSGKLGEIKTEALLPGPDWRELKETGDGAGPSGDTAVEESFSKHFQNQTTKSKVFVAVLKFKTAETAKHSYQELISSGKPPVTATQFEGFEAHDIPGRAHRYVLIGNYWLMASQNPSGTDHIEVLKLLLKQMGLAKK